MTSWVGVCTGLGMYEKDDIVRGGGGVFYTF